MDLGTSGQTPAYFLVPDLLSAAVVGKDRVADESDDWTLLLAGAISSPRNREYAQDPAADWTVGSSGSAPVEECHRPPPEL
jgi:hypothetical protein